ncbi:chaperonin CPN60-2, mitochondrial [Tanacetum coccineum]
MLYADDRDNEDKINEAIEAEGGDNDDRIVANATDDVAGDGTACATVLTRAIFFEGCKSVLAGMRSATSYSDHFPSLNSLVLGARPGINVAATFYALYSSIKLWGAELMHMTHSLDYLDENGENVILISNHQTEPDPAIIALLLKTTSPYISDYAVIEVPKIDLIKMDDIPKALKIYSQDTYNISEIQEVVESLARIVMSSVEWEASLGRIIQADFLSWAAICPCLEGQKQEVFEDSM